MFDAVIGQCRRGAEHDGISGMTDIPHILVVDDDSRLRSLLHRYLSENGFRVSSAADAVQARRNLAAIEFDLIVLDVMMPGETGLELTTSLRQTGSIPILLLTAMGEPDQRIAGLECGADDYLPKPFEPRELVARIQTILRRTMARPATSPDHGQIHFGPFRFDLRRRQLFQGQARVRLTEAETGLLHALAIRAGEILSREQLIASDAGGGQERAIDVQVTRLRRKLEPDPKFPRFLYTVRGHGYVLRIDP